MTISAMTIEVAMAKAEMASTRINRLRTLRSYCGAWVPIVPRVPLVLVPWCVGAFGA